MGDESPPLLCNVLCYIPMYYNILQCIVLHDNKLQGIIIHYNTIPNVTRYIVLHRRRQYELQYIVIPLWGM